MMAETKPAKKSTQTSAKRATGKTFEDSRPRNEPR